MLAGVGVLLNIAVAMADERQLRFLIAAGGRSDTSRRHSPSRRRCGAAAGW
jgi:hypothetical protein